MTEKEIKKSLGYRSGLNDFFIVAGQRYYYSADDLISIYRDNLQVAYNDNKGLLRAIADR